MGVKQLPRHQHEARRTKTALERPGFDERLLHGIKTVSARLDLFDRPYISTINQGCQRQTARYRLAVDDHGAAATKALGTTFTRTEYPLTLQDLDEILVIADSQAHGLTIEGE